MARCLACSQTFSQFIRPSSLLSYTGKSKTDCVFNIIWKAMISKGLNAMPALLKFLVLLASFLLASHSDAFTSLSLIAGNQVRVNHLTRLQQPMSNPTNEPSREPICEPTKRMDLNAVLPVNLSSKGGLCHDKKSERVMFSNHGMIMRSRANM